MVNFSRLNDFFLKKMVEEEERERLFPDAAIIPPAGERYIDQDKIPENMKSSIIVPEGFTLVVSKNAALYIVRDGDPNHYIPLVIDDGLENIYPDTITEMIGQEFVIFRNAIIYPRQRQRQWQRQPICWGTFVHVTDDQMIRMGLDPIIIRGTRGKVPVILNIRWDLNMLENEMIETPEDIKEAMKTSLFTKVWNVFVNILKYLWGIVTSPKKLLKLYALYKILEMVTVSISPSAYEVISYGLDYPWNRGWEWLRNTFGYNAPLDFSKALQQKENFRYSDDKVTGSVEREKEGALKELASKEDSQGLWSRGMDWVKQTLGYSTSAEESKKAIEEEAARKKKDYSILQIPYMTKEDQLSWLNRTISRMEIVVKDLSRARKKEGIRAYKDAAKELDKYKAIREDILTKNQDDLEPRQLKKKEEEYFKQIAELGIPLTNQPLSDKITVQDKIALAKAMRWVGNSYRTEKELEYLPSPALTIWDNNRKPVPVPNGFVLHDPVEEEIVIGIPGTHEMQDWGTDANAFPLKTISEVTLSDGQVKKLKIPLTGHRGFFNRFESIAPSLFTHLASTITSHQDCTKIRVYGHSLGGAEATIIGSVLKQILPKNYDISFVAVEAPRSLTTSTVRQLEAAYPAFYRTAIRTAAAGDPVPNVPGQILGFSHIGKLIYFPEVALFGTSHFSDNVASAFAEYLRPVGPVVERKENNTIPEFLRTVEEEEKKKKKVKTKKEPYYSSGRGNITMKRMLPPIDLECLDRKRRKKKVRRDPTQTMLMKQKMAYVRSFKKK